MGAFVGGDRSLSRQRRWQLRKKADSLCIVCGKKAFYSHCCKACHKKAMLSQRLRVAPKIRKYKVKPLGQYDPYGPRKKSK